MRPLRNSKRTFKLGDRVFVTEGLDYHLFSDIYHRAMTASWPRFLAGAFATFLALNVFFAVLYSFGDSPVANAPSGLTPQLFYFSIETLATVGYGDMHPQTHYGHLVASVEIFTGMVLIAMMTGMIFARFSKPQARLVFTSSLVVTLHEDAPTLMVRVANARHNAITDAHAKLWMTRAERSPEGVTTRRFQELALTRSENPLFALSWTLYHPLDAQSPLHGLSQADFEAGQMTFILSIGGHDTSFAQEVRARSTYGFADVRWNQRYLDILHTDEDGVVHVNHAIFHDTVPDGRGAADQAGAQIAESVTR